MPTIRHPSGSTHSDALVEEDAERVVKAAVVPLSAGHIVGTAAHQGRQGLVGAVCEGRGMCHHLHHIGRQPVGENMSQCLNDMNKTDDKTTKNCQ